MRENGSLAIADSSEIATESDLTAEELIARGERLLKLGRELQVQAARLRDEPPPPEIAARPAGVDADHSVGREGVVTEQSAMATARGLEVFTRIEFGDALGLNGIGTSKWLARLHERQAIVRETRETDSAIVYRYALPVEDEPATYQLRLWCSAQSEPFDLEMAIDGSGLPEREVESSLSELLAERSIAPVVIEAVDDLGEIDKLGGAFFQYVPPIPGGVQGDLERRRLASVSAAGNVEVKRGTPVRIRTERKQRGARSTPGNRQKVINQDRNWERLEAARQARAEQAKQRAKREREKPKSRRGKASKPVQS